MENFYTNVFQRNNKVYVRGFENGHRIQKTVPYKPYLFREQEGGFYRTIDGLECDKIQFDSVKSAVDYIMLYRSCDNVKVYGLSLFSYLYIYDTYPGVMQYDPNKVSVVAIDIECAADEGFPSVAEANKEITAIALRKSGKSIAFGCGDFITDDSSITYVKCEDEYELLEKFLDVWERLSPDIVTGWNIDFFDIPYMVNRIRNVLGDEEVKRLSPWGMVKERKVVVFKKEDMTYDLFGITSLDYLTLYKKFTFGNQESYSLNYIAQVELGEKKIDYSEFGSLLGLYKNNFQKFIEYNIHDAVLVERLEAKLNFIKQVIDIAYDAKVNYQDTFATVRPWDIIIHNYLLDRRIVVPQIKRISKTRQNLGGYVKEPKIGWSKWVVAFDLKSSYPHNTIQYNVSPETFAGKKRIADIDTLIKREQRPIFGEYAVAANGCLFKKDKQGFLAALMEKMFADRAVYNEKLAEAEQEYERTKDPKLLNDISKFYNMQQAKKIQLNSAYGALSNEYFRWFDIDLAEAITYSAQLAVRWIAQALNDYLNKALKTTGNDFIVASDTDSVYINMELFVVKIPSSDPVKITKTLNKFCKERIEPFIAKSFYELAEYMNAYRQCMSMARESISEKGIWTGKKRYILNIWDKKGVLYDKPKLKVTGLESVRSSTPHVCRKKFNEAFKIILEKDEMALQEFIAAFKEDFLTLPFEAVAFPRGINGMQEYANANSIWGKGTPIQVKGALIFNHLLAKYGLETVPPIRDGDKIRFAYLKEPNPIHQTVIAAPDFLPKEFNLDKYIDKELQFDKAFVEPLRTITQVINWNVEPVASLLAYF